MWPRVLTFSAPESVAVEGGDEPLLFELVVTDPEIVRFPPSKQERVFCVQLLSLSLSLSC